MKRFNLLLFLVFICFNVLSQIKTYTYENYGVVESPSNILGLAYRKLEITKFDNRFTITSFDSEATHSFEINVSLKGYNEFEEEYVYIGDATHIVRYNGKEIKAVGKCLVESHYKLDYYLENNGKAPNDIKFFSSWNKELSFIVYFNKMKYSIKVMNSKIDKYEENSYIRIFPIKNETDKERQEKKLKEIEIKKQKMDNINFMENLWSKVNIEEKVNQLGINLKEHCKKILNDSIANYNFDEVYFSNINIDIFGNFVYHIDENQKIAEIKRDVSYRIYGDHDVLNQILCNMNCFNDKNIIRDRELYSLIDKYKFNGIQKYEKDGYTIYKIDNGILVEGCRVFENLHLQIQTFAVRLKKGKLEYYTYRKNLPKEIEDWCIVNVKTNGLHFVKYMMMDNEFECKILNLNYSKKEYLKFIFNIGYRYKDRRERGLGPSSEMKF